MDVVVVEDYWQFDFAVVAVVVAAAAAATSIARFRTRK